MSTHVPMDPPCGNCGYCSSRGRTLESHPACFKIVSNSHIDGINFEADEFTANQIADAFENLTPGHMDWQIKKNAIDHWNALLLGFLEGPELRESEFDLQPVYYLLDDLLFLRALQDSCAVEWVDELPGKSGARVAGLTATEWNIRGPSMWIRIVKPSPEMPRSVHRVLCVLIHEMCHALLNLACQCTVCSCELNKINGLGVTGHGPSWQRLMLAVHETVNMHVKGFSEPFLLSPTALDLNTEVGTRAKMLESLYERVMKEDNERVREKREARSKRMIATMTSTMEHDQKLADRDETLACVVAMFEKWEGKASTIIEGKTGKEGQ